MSLSAGVYYIVSESLEAYTGDSDRTITTNIEGIVLNDMQADLSQNYVYTRTMANEDGSAFIDKIEYFDGLGRPVETVQRKASYNGLDLITYQEYDGFGRKSNSWLPRVGTDGSGKFIPFGNFQKLSPEVYDYDAKAYSRSVYDESALNHIVEQYGPGEKWHNSHKGTRMALMTNVVGNDTLNCMLFKVEDEWSNDTVLMLRREGNYTSSQLFVTRTMDEDGNRIFEFKDKLGRLILSRRMQGSDSYDTYYIYNSLGAPLVVLPPKASDLLKADTKTSWNSKDDMALRHYAYLYKYQPSRAQLCRAKKLPGCAWIYYLYDRSNRLVFTQDGNMRKRGEWLFTLPDMSGRTCLTGICHNTFNSLEPINTLIAVEPNESEEFGYSIINDTFTLVNPIVISVNFYDNYNFMNSLFYFDDTRLGYTAQSGYDKRYYTDNAVGLQTGTLTAVMDGTSVDSYLPSVMYYDYRGRLVQTKSGNHLSGEIEEGYFANNFLGAPLKSKHVHSVPNKVPLEEVYTYKYDHIGRLITVTHQLNNRTPVTLTSNKYDALGRLLSNLRNGHINLRTDYTYNVRSWLKGISGNLFTQTLYYNESRANGTNILCYNGNISGMDWRANVSGDNILRGYDFTYDALSRLIKADYLKDNNRANHFSTSYVYDKNSNIQVLQRYGQTSSTGYGLIDNLTYTLNGNQLLRVDDAASASSYNGGFEFKNGTNAVGEYAYDGNGNLTKDSNKGITGIQYNVLNLPSSITFSDGSSITYTYAADGTKLRTVHKIGNTTTTTDYCGNVIYENNTAKLLLTGEGYVSLNDNKYHYYLKDHQGNNRVVVNQSGSVEETNHYYPFGGVFASTNNVQPYKYNGKELDSKKGLN